MSLRVRLVTALLSLLAVGLGTYGVASYQAFARSELARLDDQLDRAVPVVERELLNAFGRAVGELPPGAGTGPDRPRVVVPPGTYAELRQPDGQAVGAIQVAEDEARPDVTGIGRDQDDGRPRTVDSQQGEVTWRAAASSLGDGWSVVVAVPMTEIEQALDRLIVIGLVAGAALVAVLGVGSWFVLRSGLRPLERMAASTRDITAGSLDQRVAVPAADTEVRQLGTAVNRMLDQLEDAFRERERTEAGLRRFLADASHELRTPLTSIQGYAELFRLGRHDDVDQATVARRIEDESGRMRELVEDLLALARLDEIAGRVREPVDLAVLAADACGDAAATDPDRPFALDAPEPVPVLGDPSHLRRAIGNLVVNALRHTPSGTPVHVAASRNDGFGEVRVRDRGPGLDEQALVHAFDRFWRADPARSGGGTGLGLSIVAAVADEHGGEALAGNAADGGAVFTLRIPSEPAGGRDLAGSPPPPRPARRTGRAAPKAAT